ncbi:HK97 family phage prohead protease [Chryseobacterium sp. 09-1422]|uniref:HK97 family phage prohead protease n=1 Tax=Chryseobacterium kimseyorum TaxID=2984028 RepID=A0ABT3HYN1_9FLAO|nr:HK97 family phage prohead protease [Chryseobacterium kimseyorum]MCW3168916.1 HK97 family phage prohead protease [Chryseobacterium kimseyorum]
MEYKFIVNTENVNSYGYRIITEGIDISQYERNPVVLFMHKRSEYQPTGDEVIGRARLTKEGDQLIAHITFDSKNDFASKIEQKVKGDFIRMCSMYADVIEASSDEALVKPGQKYETITKCKLIEISIVDIGGNDDAIRLSGHTGTTPKIKLLNQKTEHTMSELKTIALALGKSADSSEVTVLEAVNSLKLSLETEKTATKEWKDKYIALQAQEATKLVDRAVALGLIPEDLKDVQVKAFESDFDSQSVKLSKLIKEKEDENQTNGIQSKIGDAVQLSKTGKGSKTGDEKDTFDYLQKHDSVELSRIRSEEPQKYAQLVKSYGEGVRYTAK